jgi:chromate transporter
MSRSGPTLRQMALYFLRLGAVGFGGPVALANYMRRDLVDRFHWLDGPEYDEGLAIATACPGPLAYQLGVYCGYLTHGTVGALVVALAFAAAPFSIVTAVAALYVKYGSTWELRALFYGIGPVVVALIFKSCWDLGRKTLHQQHLAWGFAVVAAIITLVAQRELTIIFVVAGALGIILFAPAAPKDSVTSPSTADVKRAPLAAVTPLLLAAVPSSSIFFFFLKTGFLVFGSGLVVVPFLKAYVVDQYHWLDNRAFLDAVAIGIISPGPVVITATFVGYVLDSLPGALAATAGIFLPSLVFVIIGTPILRRYRTNRRVQGFVRGVTVAVVGVLVGTSILVAKATLLDIASAVIFGLSLAILFSKWKVPEQAMVAGGAVAGLVMARFAH